MRTPPRTRKSGAVAVEAAIVLPILFLLVIGIVCGGINVFHHQQVANLAREAARYASVRGGDFQKDENLDSPTKSEIVDRAIRPRAVGMDPDAIVATVEWIDRGTGAVHPWDASSKAVHSISASGEYVSNTVRVTVAYTVASGPFGDPVLLRGVCELPMSH
jgi:Flp pilus assembly protein TadG